MTGHTHRNTKLALTMLCIGALGACSPSDRTAMDTAAARTDSAAGRLDSSATAAGHNMTDSGHANMASNSGWTNDRIFGFTHNVDNGEIALGKLASTKATNPQVKAFARQLVTDHQAMMKESHAQMGKVNAKVDSTWNDAQDLANTGRDKLKDLTDKEAGNDWDKNFMDSQVEIHQKVLDRLTDAAKNPTDSTLAKTLVKASGKIQEHLTKAQSIKATLQ